MLDSGLIYAHQLKPAQSLLLAIYNHLGCFATTMLKEMATDTFTLPIFGDGDVSKRFEHLVEIIIF